ncbi:J domain-containing protein [Streptomyces sedi]|uniref:J domain-containing protein n=1 Tax=Streptomyces sedi TaxID=555059 RepID=A0A5C4V3I9_9ACTN|nr:J domain-containing protein [Streptomyces sedi]TNM30323.1 J domain-containing protein [Streptomyces sedi]
MSDEARDDAARNEAAGEEKEPDGSTSDGTAPDGTTSEGTPFDGTASDASAPGAPGDGGGPEAEAGTRRLAQAVRAAENALIEFEIAVETYRIEVENFSRLHEQRLGPLYAKIEELDAKIAEAIAARTGDPEDQRRAREARAAVTPMPLVSELFSGWLDGEGFTPEGYAMMTDQSVQPPPRVRPSEEARKLYRELARRCHPDLSTDPTERGRRDAFLSRVNQAYARGDADELRALTEEWENGGKPDDEPLAPGASELYARLEWLASRKELLADAATALEDSAVGSMLRMAEDDPDALLDEVAEGLRRQIATKEAELARLTA